MIIAQTPPPPAGFDWLAMVTGAALALFGAFSAIVAEGLKNLLIRPRVRLSFVPDDHCLRDTPAVITLPLESGGTFDSECRMSVVRFHVLNAGRTLAKSCRAYLDEVHRIHPSGSEELLCADRIPLKWAYVGFDAQDIPGETGIYCDLASTDNLAGFQKKLSLHVTSMPLVLKWDQLTPGTYRFRCYVAGENVKPAWISIMIDWKEAFPIHDVWVDLAPRKVVAVTHRAPVAIDETARGNGSAGQS